MADAELGDDSTILVLYLSGVYGRGLSKMEVIFTERICSRGGGEAEE
jgi:hypothetical protein